MKKSLKRAAAASAVCAVSLAGTLATNPTAVAGEAAEARANQKAITDFGMKALAFGTKVSVGGVDIKSLKDSLDILACTLSAGVERVKPSKLSTDQITQLIAENAPVDIAKLISISPSTSRTSTYREGGVTGTREVGRAHV